MHPLLQECRYGLRGLRNQPGFTVLALVALGLGIGSVTIIFSVIQNVLLDPFPYKDADRVVAVEIHDLDSSRFGGRDSFQVPEFLEYQKQNHVFEDVIGGSYEDVLYFNGQGTEQFNGGLTTANLFQFLGISAQVGRIFTPDDVKPGAPPVFVMSYKMWMKEFNRDPGIVGRSFILNGVPTILVGIMPERVHKMAADLWLPVALNPADLDLKQRSFMLQARLKRGASIKTAEADLNVIAQHIAPLYPKDYPKRFTVQVESWVNSVVGQFRKVLFTLMAAVGLLMLIACANVANMLLARATVREKEMAVRSAMGASRGRLVRQLLVESLLLALGGAALGCLFAWGGLKVLVEQIPDGSIPREAIIQINIPVLLFCIGAAVLTALLFGLVPAIQTARTDIVEPLKDSGRGISGGFRHGKLRNALVVTEVALSLVLLVGAGLLMHSFVKLQRVDLGFNPENILVSRLPFPRGQYKAAIQKQQFFSQLLQRLAAAPGVIAATETSALPPYGGIQSDINIPGKVHNEKWNIVCQLVSEGYFPTLQLRLLRGRTLSEAEVSGARRVAVVNETLVKKFFGTDDPMGRQIRINQLATMPDSPVENPVFEVIGVTADAKNQGLQDPTMPEMFIPYTITGAFERGILVRTARDPLALQNTVRREVWALDRNVAITLNDSLENYLKAYSYSGPRFSLILLSVFAGVGLVLVALGVYSVVAYTVSRQTHEIGIRMALGAGHGDVLGMVLRMGLRLLAFGVAVGLLASFGVARVIASQLWGVSPYDPLTLCSVVLVVGLAGLAACYFPARRATRVDPITSLHYE
ncbi:MAG TPA: ABC transporter permease [Bryobacteraceae bacterium]|nr:ABC transporter permease [Bryobacteraceae bacterium]